MYCHMIHALTHMDSGRPCLLIDVDGIKIMSLSFNMHQPDVFPSQVKSVLDRHGIDKVSVVGHSFGSITAGEFI